MAIAIHCEEACIMSISRDTFVEPIIHPSTIRPLAQSLWRVEEKGVRCLACARECQLHKNNVGFCTAVVNWRDALYSTAYGVVGEASVTPIENRPIYHYRPGSATLLLGGLGCNLRCRFCQNWEVAFRDARRGGNLAAPNLLPEQAVALALEQNCQGLGWSFNEPSIAPMYTLDCARLAREVGLYTVFVTNGMMTKPALDLLGPYIDVYRVDVKSLDSSFYQRVAGTRRINTILPIARLAQQEFGVHVETVTNLMPSLNDSDEHLKRLAEQIVLLLGANTPWHLTTYIPYAHMTHIPATPLATLKRAYDIGVSAGLRFVYMHRSLPEDVSTFCPGCHIPVVKRTAQRVQVLAVGADGSCTHCGTQLGIITDSDVTV
jgi:pyruvate formate lyase activating enzyme